MAYVRYRIIKNNVLQITATLAAKSNVYYQQNIYTK